MPSKHQPHHDPKIPRLEGDFILIVGNESPDPQLVETLAVFARGRVASDALGPEEISAQGLRELESPRHPGIPEEWRPGELLNGQSRLLLENLGSQRSRFFAIPTTKGRICTVLTGIGAEVVPALHKGLSMSAHKTEASGPLYVYGLVENEVIHVRVLVSDQWLDAVVGANAFFLEVAAEKVSSRSVKRIELGLVGGGSRLVSIDSTKKRS